MRVPKGGVTQKIVEEEAARDWDDEAPKMSERCVFGEEVQQETQCEGKMSGLMQG